MGWGMPAPLRCELNLLGRSCGAGWVNKELYRAAAMVVGKGDTTVCDADLPICDDVRRACPVFSSSSTISMQMSVRYGGMAVARRGRWYYQ